MARQFPYAFNSANRYTVEYLPLKRGRQETMTNARYVVSHQQPHLVGFIGRRRVAIGSGTAILHVEVLLPAQSPAAS